MAFGGITHDLGSFGEETDKTTTLHQISRRNMHSDDGDGVRILRQRMKVAASKETLEASTKRRRQKYYGAIYQLVLGFLVCNF